MTLKRTIRQAQLVSPFGVGSIMDIGPESFVIADISRWNQDGLRLVEESRLEDKLRQPIRTPSGKEGATSIAISRFPKWHFCPKCRRMRRVTSHEDQARDYPIPKCEDCKPRTEMTPMGFVAVCDEGHLGDVDWHYWAHRKSGASKGVCSPQTARLFFETSGQGGGDWAAITVRCQCGAKNDFSGLIQVESPGGMRCGGRQPWAKAEVRCASPISVFRRASSNLHFPKTVSALDLAADASGSSDPLSLAQSWLGDPVFMMIKTVHQSKPPNFWKLCERWVQSFAERNGCSVEAAAAALRIAVGDDASASGAGEIDATEASGFQQQILREEWAVLAGGLEVNGRFLQIRPVVPPHDWPAELRRTVVGVSMVRRLREVRALLGFRRLAPGEENTLVHVDLGKKKSGWFPGVEAWGEGIFVRLSESAVREWEAKAAPIFARRIEKLLPRVTRMGWDAEIACPRFLMLHSLAHAIVRRLSFDAGYSASSMKERIYSSPAGAGMCGILIYTADGDSEGSLGGLVRMGNPR